jgi:hydrophobe/amphiphile efflux-1 (HAE1) family protein
MSALIIFGAISFNRLGISQMPDVDFPVLSVEAVYEGASPEIVEAELIDPIEQALLSIEGIEEMRSSVRQGSGTVNLNFDINRDVDTALQEVQSALSRLRFPAGVDPPVVEKRNPEESPIMFIGVASEEKSLRDLIIWVENSLLDEFRFIKGIGQVSIGGFSTRNLRVWPDLEKLKRADLTVVDLLDAVQSQHLESAAGQFSDGKREFRVRWLGEAATPEEIGEIQILRRGGQIIQEKVYRIRDVAEVEDGLSDVRRVARFDGKQAIAIAVRKQRGGNEVALAKAIHEKIAKLSQVSPDGIQLRVNVDFTKATESVVQTTYGKLWAAAAITIITCFLFLGSFQAAVNILFSIPTSIVGTFIILYFAGFTLNLFSLLALTLAISIVVDDAIMLLENIVRHSRMGKNPAQAAYDGAVEILPAAIAATLAVVAVFLPVVFMSGITGKFFFQFGITMSAAVLLSLLEAITITPMRAAALMSKSSKISKLEHWLERLFERIGHVYQMLLGLTLRLPLVIVVVSLGMFAASVYLIQGIKQEFIPQQDQNVILMSMQTPAGTSLEETYLRALKVEEILGRNPHIEGFFMSLGGGAGASEVNQVTFPLYLKPRELREVSHLQVMASLRKEFQEMKGLKVSMRDISARGLTSGRLNPVSFNIRGPDLKVLQDKTTQIMERLDQEKLTLDLDSDFRMGLPELLIRPNRKAMAERGVSVQAVARTLSATAAGIRQSQFTGDGRRYDIRFKLREQYLRSAKDLEGIEVRNNYGLRVPLVELVTFSETETYQSINRVNRQRAIGVFGNVGPGQSQGDVLKKAETIAREILPDGYTFSLEGASAGLAESFQSLGLALVLGVLVAYMILAVQFNSFVHPISILIALPFSLSGALLVLWQTGVSLNLFSFIGIIVLMGIAKKNSILLVEFTNQLREKGERNVKAALLAACPIRLRPVLMTSAATIAAAIPLVVGNSMGQEIRTPMGLTILGGTAVSTVFTLFVVPSLYLILSRFESKRSHDLTI